MSKHVGWYCLTILSYQLRHRLPFTLRLLNFNPLSPFSTIFCTSFSCSDRDISVFSNLVNPSFAKIWRIHRRLSWQKWFLSILATWPNQVILAPFVRLFSPVLIFFLFQCWVKNKFNIWIAYFVYKLLYFNRPN